MRVIRGLFCLFLITCLLMAQQCGSKFDRVIAALDAAPALIDSFADSTPEEQRQWKAYFSDATAALRAYKQARTDENWSEFIRAFETIARNRVSDSRGQQRITAIVTLTRIILGIPDTSTSVRMSKTESASAAVETAPPKESDMRDSDIKQLERLMKPLS